MSPFASNNQPQQQRNNPSQQFQSQRFPAQMSSGMSQQAQKPLPGIPGMGGQRFAQMPGQPMQPAPQQFQPLVNQQQSQQPYMPSMNDRRTYPMSRQSGQVRQSGFLTTPYREGLARSTQGNTATLELRLQSYLNRGLTMPNGMTCDCPQQNRCTFLKNIASPCLFSFTAVIVSADQSVNYISTDFIPFNSSGLSGGEWTTPITVDMTTKPQSIDVFVHNLGPVIDQQTSQAVYFDYLTLVDIFVIDLRDYLPIGFGDTYTLTHKVLTGQQVRSTLEVNYAVLCKTGYMGQSCELQCRTTNMPVLNQSPAAANFGQSQAVQPVNNALTASNNPQQQQNQQRQSQNSPPILCTSVLANATQQQQCTFLNQQRTQVRDCNICNFGVNENNNTCKDAASVYGNMDGVSAIWRTLAFIFGGLLLLLLIALIVLCVVILIGARKKRDERNERPVMQRPPYARAVVQDRSARPLLGPDSGDFRQPSSAGTASDEWTKPSVPPAVIQRGMRPQHAPIADTNETSPSDESEFRSPPRREAQV
ncbi:hypothetical protein Ddc_00916 [Ditylenchus destructor]|nr:hypothetical protein Ddc_00916 [Ditylenchus destructor]